jgi:serine O-acetyltransferase
MRLEAVVTARRDADFDAAAAILRRLHEIVAETLSSEDRAAFEQDDATFGSAISRTVSLLEEDLAAFAASDPAAGGSPETVFRSYSSFDAVAHYRVAHAILQQLHGSLAHRAMAARSIAERGKVRSGVDIHPAAAIGRRFILDHAVGTVIGETSVIRNDCYVLGGVTLGARGIARNARGKRHPTIGDRVQIGAFARVLGPVRVGDDVFISPSAVVTCDVPSRTRVSIVNQMQLQHSGPPAAPAIEVYGIGLVGRSLFVLGAGLSSPSAVVLDDDFRPVADLSPDVSLVDGNLMRIGFGDGPPYRPAGQRLHIQVRDGNAEVILLDPRGLRDLLEAGAAAASQQAVLTQG